MELFPALPHTPCSEGCPSLSATGRGHADCPNIPSLSTSYLPTAFPSPAVEISTPGPSQFINPGI